MQLQQSAGHMSDYEGTIKKFRERTVGLQEQIQDLKDQVLTAEAKSMRTSDLNDNDEGTPAYSINKSNARSFAEVCLSFCPSSEEKFKLPFSLVEWSVAHATRL